MPQLPQAYSLTTIGCVIVPGVTKACKQGSGMPVDFGTVIGLPGQGSVTERRVVTHLVNSLPIWEPCSLIREFRCRQFRHDVGRYLPSMVLGVQVQMMLPAWLMGDRTMYLLLALIWVLALGPLNKTLITPLVTSTLET